MKTFIKDFITTGMYCPDGKYDATLTLSDSDVINSENANLELLITLKVNLTKNENFAGQIMVANKSFKFDKWPDSAWQFFLANFEYQANMVWDKKLWFILNKFKVSAPAFQQVKKHFLITKDVKTFKGDMNMYLYCRPIACRFKLQLVTDTGNPHQHVEVFFIAPVDGTIPNNSSMRSDSGHMDLYDILTTGGTNQSVIAHEVGHLLGLPHIGITTNSVPCLAAISLNPMAQGETVCYIAKGTGVEKDNNIMGNGTIVDERNASPWKKALYEMTGIPNHYWNISMVKETPNSVGIYGQVDKGCPLWNEYHPFEIFQGFLKETNDWWERAI